MMQPHTRISYTLHSLAGLPSAHACLAPLCPIPPSDWTPCWFPTCCAISSRIIKKTDVIIILRTTPVSWCEQVTMAAVARLRIILGTMGFGRQRLVDDKTVSCAQSSMPSSINTIWHDYQPVSGVCSTLECVAGSCMLLSCCWCVVVVVFVFCFFVFVPHSVLSFWTGSWGVVTLR